METAIELAGRAGSRVWPWAPERRTRTLRVLAGLVLVATVAAAGVTFSGTTPARAGTVAGMKAVVIVGPASSSTSEYLREGEQIARQAEAQGMDVRRIFTPRATWRRVKANLQGANLVVYLGHGNGWPSAMAPFRGESKNGFGLNACEVECGTSGPPTYYGEAYIREQIRLAPNAVVYLHRLCYASGNAESGMAPVFDRDLATARASNFASGFIDAGAGVVFALGWEQRLNLPAALAGSGRSMDQLFMLPGSDGDYYDGFVGWDDYYRDSTRDRGARVHLDPHRRHGHLRAITGDLQMTAAEWRGEAPAPDEVPPTVQVRSTGTTDRPGTADLGEPVTFSPNGDGLADRMLIRRSLSEPAFLGVQVRNAAGTVVRRFSRFAERGGGETVWDGRNDNEHVVADGIYEVRLTPRDRAGNVGETASVGARVLTSLRRLQSSTRAIHVSDQDDLAAAAVLRAALRRDARVTWQIRRNGNLVRTRYQDQAVAAGDLEWRWNGRNADGRLVPDGRYDVSIAATTDVGTLRYGLSIRVGNWHITADDLTPRRGQDVRIVARSVEPLRAGAKLEISLPGLRLRRVDMVRRDRHVLTGRFRVASSATDGAIGLRVLATDTGGQPEVGRLRLQLR